jgi:hypothetical protein
VTTDFVTPCWTEISNRPQKIACAFLSVVFNFGSHWTIYKFLRTKTVLNDTRINQLVTYYLIMSADRSVVWRWATGWMIGGSSPGRAGNFSRHRIQAGSGTHPASYPIGKRYPSLGVKRPVHEADHSPPSSAEVKNAWSYTSTPPIRLHSVVLSKKKHRDNFAFAFTLITFQYKFPGQNMHEAAKS